MKALVIVDMQYDFLPGGTLPVPHGQEVIAPINQLVKQDYNLILATQDWHPSDHLSFASQHQSKQPFDQIMLHGFPQTLWPDHCVQATHGAVITDHLDLRKVEAIFRKGMDREIDSYSGFYDNNKKKATGMLEYLRAKAITQVDFCGLAADYCVYYSAKDALEAGFESCIMAKATRAINNNLFEKLSQSFIAVGGKISY